MAYLDIEAIREELSVFLKNQDVISTTIRGVTTVTEEFNGTGSQLDFVLTNTAVRNVRSVTVGGATKDLKDDYTVDYEAATVTFTQAPAAGTNNVDIQYDYGSTDSIFTNFPKNTLQLGSFPRIGVDLISSPTKAAGFGNVHETTIVFSVRIQARRSIDIANYGKVVRQYIIANRTNFKYLNVIMPQSIGAVIPGENKHGKILQQNFDFESRFNYEIN